MAIPKFLQDLAIISKLGDNPGSDNNLTTSGLRAKFDEAGLEIQEYINNTLIPALSPLVDPTEGMNMKGDIAMGGYKVTGLGTPVEEGDAVPLRYANQAFAPAGFGLGTTSVNIDTVYDITENGLYLTDGDTPDGSWWFANAVVTNGGASIIVDAWKLNGTMRSLIVKNNGAWGDWISWQDFLTNGGTKNGNFDELVDVGIYWMQTAYCTHSPYGEDDTGHYGFLLVSKAAPGSVLQIFVEYSTSATYVRNNVNGWKSWVRTDAGIAADHIVAQGTSGIWNYRKWNSGVAECWANYTFAPGAFESAGTSSCFYYAVSDAIAFPFTFVELKSVQANVNSWRYGNWASSATVNKLNATFCRVMLFQTHNQIHSDGYEIAIHAVGTWK